MGGETVGARPWVERLLAAAERGAVGEIEALLARSPLCEADDAAADDDAATAAAAAAACEAHDALVAALIRAVARGDARTVTALATWSGVPSAGLALGSLEGGDVSALQLALVRDDVPCLRALGVRDALLAGVRCDSRIADARGAGGAEAALRAAMASAAYDSPSAHALRASRLYEHDGLELAAWAGSPRCLSEMLRHADADDARARASKGAAATAMGARAHVDAPNGALRLLERREQLCALGAVRGSAFELALAAAATATRATLRADAAEGARASSDSDGHMRCLALLLPLALRSAAADMSACAHAGDGLTACDASAQTDAARLLDAVLAAARCDARALAELVTSLTPAAAAVALAAACSARHAPTIAAGARDGASARARVLGVGAIVRVVRSCPLPWEARATAGMVATPSGCADGFAEAHGCAPLDGVRALLAAGADAAAPLDGVRAHGRGAECSARAPSSTRARGALGWTAVDIAAAAAVRTARGIDVTHGPRGTAAAVSASLDGAVRTIVRLRSAGCGWGGAFGLLRATTCAAHAAQLRAYAPLLLGLLEHGPDCVARARLLRALGAAAAMRREGQRAAVGARGAAGGGTEVGARPALLRALGRALAARHGGQSAHALLELWAEGVQAPLRAAHPFSLSDAALLFGSSARAGATARVGEGEAEAEDEDELDDEAAEADGIPLDDASWGPV
ncbi:hypothetical protein KFE25_011109 [Diacronema lutheri]|uniref:Uncharacterized protein n=1 Tax=Diacronema lutheri TaxID=2081491 RepID=A0A8J5XKF9_DIALT|nr:hypothetical protein KFE25_011109 [Diacronema lutheri]